MDIATTGAIEFPDWTLLPVREEIERLLARGLPDDQVAILRRIGTLPDARAAWTELIRTNRKTGAYLYRPRSQPIPWIGPKVAQDQALRETVCAVFVAARDGIEADKGEAAAVTREEMLQEAAVVRKIAADLLKTNSADPLARTRVEAMRWAAAWWEKGANALRGPGDPFVVGQERGNKIQRGVQRALTAFFQERFGRPLHGIAATFAAVALDSPKLSEWASRSAVSRPEPP